MKTLISVVLALFVVASVQAQNPDVKFIPGTLSAGTSMVTRTCAQALDDTTVSIRVGGYSAVYVHLVTSANDSSCTRLAYSVSNDGATFGAYTLWDSLSTTGTVGANKAFALPAGALGGEYVRIRVYGSDANIFSSSPTTKVTTVIRKKLY
jgi:hypothetical protein